MNLSDWKEPGEIPLCLKDVVPIKADYSRIFFARRHFWNKWQGFEVKSVEEYKDWHEKHKGWKKTQIFFKGEIHFPDTVLIERWTLQNKEVEV